MLVEVAATEDFRNAKQFRSPAPLTPGTDWTGRLRVIGLEPDQQIHYRVTLEDVDTAVRSASQTGTFRTAPLPSSASAPRSIRLHWSGDVAGQGWGINDAFDGYVGFAAMADRNPDLFIHSGDTCYADGSLKETVTLSDGTVWRNRVTPAKSKVAETLEEYRGQYAYNLMDDNYLRFNFQVAQLVQWDDHETVNNWYPGEILDDDRYRERRVDVLAERAYQAFHEWQPIDERPAVSRKLPASSAQLRTSRTSFGSLRTCTTRLRTTTARSARSSRTSLRSGSSSPPPLHAGALGPNEMDSTFGPSVEFVHAPGKDNAGADPTQDFQHFGEVNIDGDSRAMTVRLLTTRGTELWSTTLQPQ